MISSLYQAARLTWVCVLSGALSLVAASLRAQGEADTRTVQQLPNGLSYYFTPQTSQLWTGGVELRLVVRAGSAYETDAERGAAFLVSQLALQGSARIRSDSLQSTLQTTSSDAGDDPTIPSVSTSYLGTVYRLNVRPDSASVAQGLAILAGWARGVTVTSALLDSGRPGVLAARAALEKEFPSQTLFDSALYAGTAYALHPAVPTEGALKVLGAEAAQQFVRATYRPDNMAVVIVGEGIPAAQLQQMVVSNFGTLPTGSGERRALPAVPGTAANASAAGGAVNVVVLSDPAASVARIHIVLRRPGDPLATGGPEGDVATRDSLMNMDSLFLELLNNRLAGLSVEPGSPVERASAAFVWTPLEGRHIVCEAAVRGQEVATAVRLLMSEISDVAQHGFTKDELEFFSESDKMFAHPEEPDITLLRAQQSEQEFLTGMAISGDVAKRRMLMTYLQTTYLGGGDLVLTPEMMRGPVQTWVGVPQRTVVVVLPKALSAASVPTQTVVTAATEATEHPTPAWASAGRQLVILKHAKGQNSLYEALAAEVAKAAKLGYTPLVDFGAPWCGACLILQQGLETPAFLATFARSYIIRVNVDDWKGQLYTKSLGRPRAEGEFDCSTIPQLYVIDRAGRPLGQSVSIGNRQEAHPRTAYETAPVAWYEPFWAGAREAFAKNGKATAGSASR